MPLSALSPLVAPITLFIVLGAFIAIGAGLAWYFISHDHGEREPVGALWIALGFGVLGALLAGILEWLLLPSRDLAAGAPISKIFLASMGVGIIEESCKFVPLAFFIYKRRYFNEHTDGIIYFAIAGLGFGVPENILYTLQFGAAVGFNRIILTPFFHAATTAMVGYFLVRGKLAKKSRLTSWLILGLAMFIHGMYDFGLISGIGILSLLSVAITITMSILLFVFYSKAGERDRQMGLSVVGINNFCRSCGFPNPQRRLYCTNCGRHA